MKSRLLAAVAVVSLAGPSHAKPKDWQTASDVAVYSLMAFSVGLPALKGDQNGAFQAAGSIAATTLITEGMKEAIPKLRPDGSDRKSFPSGHASRAFAAAATLYDRQGQKIGIPAFFVAGFVGIARVEGKKHYWTDVAAGAALGTAAGFLITDTFVSGDQATLSPWVEHKGGGVSIAVRF